MGDVIPSTPQTTVVSRQGNTTLVKKGESAIEATRQAARAEGFATSSADSAEDSSVYAAIALAAAVTSDEAMQRSARRVRAVKAAAGDPAAVVLKLTEDAERTYESGVGPTLATVTAEIGGVLDAIVPGFGEGQQAYHTAAGIVPARGLTITAELLPDGVAACSIDIAFVQPAIAHSFASVAAMNAAAAGYEVDQVVYAANPSAVLVDPGAFDQPPADTIGGLYIPDPSNLNQGYWIKRGAPYDDFARYNSLVLEMGATGGKRFEVYCDMRGQWNAFIYDGSSQAGPQQYYTDTIAHRPGEPQHLRIDIEGGCATLWWNADEQDAAYAAVDFVPDHLAFYGAITLKDVTITQGLDFAHKRAVTDSLADEYGFPRQYHTDTAELIVFNTQSEFTATTDTSSDSWAPPAATNWTGMVTGRSDIDARLSNPSQEHLSGVFGQASAAPDQLGPIKVPMRLDGGGPIFTYTMAGNGAETVEWGFASQWRLREGGGNHLYFVGECVGGASLSQLQDSSGIYLHALGDYSAADLGTHYRDLLYRKVIPVAKRCRARGQTLRVAFLGNFQAKTDVGIVGTAAAHEADLRDVLAKLYTLIEAQAGKPPVLSAMAPNFSYDGVGTGTNTAGTNYVDDAYRRIGANKDTTHPILPLLSVWKLAGPNVHWLTLTKRKIGEWLGARSADHFLLGKFRDPLQWTVANGTGGDAGKLVITFNRPALQVNALGVTIPAKVTSGGHDTLGFGVEAAGSFAISGNVAWRSASGSGYLQATVPYSGTKQVGDRVYYLGAGSFYGNVIEAEAHDGLYEDQDWGTVPLAADTPALAFGDPNDLRDGLAAASFAWNGSAFA